MQKEISLIQSLLSDESSLIEVQRVANGLPDWKISEGRLVNSRTDYFSLGAVLDDAGATKFIMRQTEPVLVVLFVRRTTQGFSVLASIRSEPGLIGNSNLTSTIQSTKSNYMREHGGRATPYLEYVMNLKAASVIHDSTQFDWGEHYEGKTKRFLIIWSEDKLEALEGFLWLDLRILQKLMLLDNLITNDFRACLTLLMGTLSLRKSNTDISQYIMMLEANKTYKDAEFFNYVDIGLLGDDSNKQSQYKDDFGNVIEFFSTKAKNREVSTWVQPLLSIGTEKQITLFTCVREQSLWAVCPKSELGTFGKKLWSPSEPKDRTSGNHISIKTSGEGGRFYKYRIALEIITLSDNEADSCGFPEDNVWMSFDEINSLIETSVTTSLELRLVWSIVLANRDF